MNMLGEQSREQVSARLSDAAVGRGHVGKCRPAALDGGILHPRTDLFQFRPCSGPVAFAPKPVVAEWKARPLRAGASVGSSMRSFANGNLFKIDHLSPIQREAVPTIFTPSADRGILDISPDIHDFALRGTRALQGAALLPKSEHFVPNLNLRVP
jgi:hypothetical protein